MWLKFTEGIDTMGHNLQRKIPLFFLSLTFVFDGQTRISKFFIHDQVIKYVESWEYTKFLSLVLSLRNHGLPHNGSLLQKNFKILLSHTSDFNGKKIVFNLFVTSKNETTNSPILGFKVLHKGQRAFKNPFLIKCYFLFITLKNILSLSFSF